MSGNTLYSYKSYNNEVVLVSVITHPINFKINDGGFYVYNTDNYKINVELWLKENLCDYHIREVSGFLIGKISDSITDDLLNLVNYSCYEACLSVKEINYITDEH